jgi:cytochrome c oxidase subunit 2
MAAACVLAGCGGDQSTLSPKSPQSRDVADLWWWMLAAAVIVFAGAVGLLVLGWARRRSKGLPIVGEDDGFNRRVVVVFGIAIPVISLVALFIVADLVVVKSTQAPAASSTPMTIRVIGHQWFWEARYPGSNAVTANEIHIPARTRVNVIATTDDVIHSLWVPELNRKVDMIPGRRNRLLMYAEKPGVYRGQCAEFCGLQHAHMSLEVFADPPAKFRRWLRNMAAPRRAPATAEARRGEQVFLSAGCASCHTIRGTAARGTVGPDLTHLASRTTLAGLTIPNNRVYLNNWVGNPQHVKPGNKMPALPLRGRDMRALITYLRSLR